MYFGLFHLLTEKIFYPADFELFKINQQNERVNSL